MKDVDTMKQADVVVIGGSAAGIPAAITARRHYPENSISLIRKEKQVLRVVGTLLTHQIIFRDYFGNDEEFIEMLIDILYTRSLSGDN